MAETLHIVSKSVIDTPYSVFFSVRHSVVRVQGRSKISKSVLRECFATSIPVTAEAMRSISGMEATTGAAVVAGALVVSTTSTACSFFWVACGADSWWRRRALASRGIKMPLWAPNVHIKKQEVRWEVPFSTKYCKAKKIFSIVHFVARKKRSNYWRKMWPNLAHLAQKLHHTCFWLSLHMHRKYAPKYPPKRRVRNSDFVDF